MTQKEIVPPRRYSMVVHSFLMYWIYGMLIGGGLSIIVAQYCVMTRLDSTAPRSILAFPVA